MLGGAEAAVRLGLQCVGSHARLGRILGRAFRLNFLGVEYVVRTQFAIRQSLRSVAESIGQRIAALVGHGKTFLSWTRLNFTRVP